jgi:hypothetical protein
MTIITPPLNTAVDRIPSSTPTSRMARVVVAWACEMPQMVKSSSLLYLNKIATIQAGINLERYTDMVIIQPAKRVFGSVKIVAGSMIIPI